MSADTSPKIVSLIAGCWLGAFGIYFALGVFRPKLRGRWGRGGQGAPMSLLSQIIWSAGLILSGAGGILSACHNTWVDHAFPYIFIPLFASLMIMGWRDNRNFKRHDKNSA
jgi:hypothetical protein